MEILQLANEDRSTTIDLIGGMLHLEGGFDASTPGWGGEYTYEPFGAQFDFSNFQPQTATFALTATGTSAAVLAEMDRLQDFLEQVRLFHSGNLQAQSGWLEWSAHGEEPKRSLLYAGAFQVTSRDNITPGLRECTVLGTLSLSRHPLWESLPTEFYAPNRFVASYHTQLLPGALSALGGKYDYTNVEGNTLGRMPTVQFDSLTAIPGNPITELWCGIRRENRGVTNFESVWDCEDGTNVAGDTGNVLDGTAYGGSKKTTTFAVGGFVERFNIDVQQVCTAAGHADYDHQQGRYLVLARCKVVGASGVAGIQMRYGYGGNMAAEEVYVDNLAWKLVPLGNISIPPWEGYDYNEFYMYSYQIDIWAEELVTCDLDMDCLVMIPNEHMVYLDGADIYNDVLDGTANIRTHEDDREDGANTAVTVINDALELVPTDWYIPPGNGTVIVAAQLAGIHNLTDTVTPYITYIPRWTNYRGE